MLLHQLAELYNPHASLIDRTIEDFAAEREPTEPPTPFTGAKRSALDSAFRHHDVALIIKDLMLFSQISANESVKQWASNTLAKLSMRSPTSLKVALKAIRLGKRQSLLDTLNMELKIATAFSVSFLAFHYIYINVG
jgi:3-hydroxyisobutyryl-CoA hydrolase